MGAVGPELAGSMAGIFLFVAPESGGRAKLWDTSRCFRGQRPEIILKRFEMMHFLTLMPG
jgi:hypothetical protein